MPGIVFEQQTGVLQSDPNRADIACFAGFVALRPGAVLPEVIRAWLVDRGWGEPRLVGSTTEGEVRRMAELEELIDLPVPVDSWEAFDQMFDWDQRPVANSSSSGFTYLGTAVRSFFAQGGRKCFVVRMGDPIPYLRPAADRRHLLSLLIPGFPNWVSSSPSDRLSWSGVGHLFGLPDVSMLCLPDLPDITGADQPPPEAEEEIEEPPEQFVECSEPEEEPADRRLRGVPAPRCDEEGYRLWSRGLSMVARMLARSCREVQLIASVPLPEPSGPASADLLAFLDRREGPLRRGLEETPDGLATAFVQLVYPWLRTGASDRLPAGFEPPEGVLCGILAQTALSRGSFSSAAGTTPLEVSDLHPLLPRNRTQGSEPGRRSLVERVSLFGLVSGGAALISDVTTFPGESYRPAATGRLVTAILRAARQLGEDVIFEASGEQLWRRVSSGLTSLLTGLLRQGALVGSSPEEAFNVRCDRSTMTQNDIDNGRVICRVEFVAAGSIETITVVMSLEEGGQVSVLTTGTRTGEAAA